MSNKIKFTPLEKEELVLKYRELNISLSAFCMAFNVERTAIIRWSIKYDNGGPEGLCEITNRTIYSYDTFVNSVKDYLSKEYSMIQIVKKYNLSGDSVLRNWLKWYNTPKWNQKVGEFMAREKITKEDKLKMVLEYLNKVKSAKQISIENNISEYQIRDWGRKYKASGENALDDNRGHRLSIENLNENQLLERKNKELQEKNKRLEAELLLIKKLKQLERGVIKKR